MVNKIFDDVLMGDNYEDFYPTLKSDFSLPIVVPASFIIIDENGLFVQSEKFFDRLADKPQFVSFERIYDIYFREEIQSTKMGLIYFQTFNIMYLLSVLDVNKRKSKRMIVSLSKDDVMRYVAIARKAMQDYHHKHNITNLPKVKFIKQRSF